MGSRVSLEAVQKSDLSAGGWSLLISRESSVNIVTSLRAGRPTNLGSISIKSKENSCFRLRRLQAIAGGVNQPMREAQHSPATSLRVLLLRSEDRFTC